MRQLIGRAMIGDPAFVKNPVARLLDKGYALNGVIMVSAVFDLRTLFFAPNEDLPYSVYLPTIAATTAATASHVHGTAGTFTNRSATLPGRGKC